MKDKSLIEAMQAAANIRGLTGRVSKAGDAALYRVGNDVSKKAIPYTPKDRGDLRGTAYVTQPKRSGGEYVVEVGFGGQAAPYALAVHEMGVSGKTKGKKIAWSEPGTGARYLSRALDEVAVNMDKLLAKYISEITGIKK